MANPDPQTPEEPGTESPSEPRFHSPDYLNDSAETQKIFDEIVSELSDLSTDGGDHETLRTDKSQDRPVFPKAPWVVADHWTDRDEPEDLNRQRASSATNPRDWSDDKETLSEIDGFVEPNPPLEIGSDPARNLGWFLTTFSLFCALIVFMFSGASQRITFAILGTLFLAGLGLLLWRMPTESKHDLDGGAQV